MNALHFGQRGLALASLITLAGCTAVPPTSGNGQPSGVTKPTNAVASGKVAVSMKAINYTLAARQAQAISATNTNNSSVDSILSGSPDQMVVYLQAITGFSSGSVPVTFWTAPASAGVAISLQNGNADLSALNVGQLSVPVGSYDGVVLQFARVGQVKGSVRGTFGFDLTSSTGPYAQSPAAGAANQYTNESVQRGQVETFATRSDMSELAAETFSTAIIGHNADFDPALNQKTDAELADIDLCGDNSDNLSIAEIRRANVRVECPGAFAIAQDATASLTLAVDLNRMLRFYANTRGDHQPPNPGMKAGTSYFFTTVFGSSITAFGGAIGSIQGYQLTANSVNAWLTLFLDSSGNVLSASVMPDDDNALTIMKGPGGTFTGQLNSGMGMALGISHSTLAGFQGVALNATGSATLTLNQASGNGLPVGTQYELTYQRLL